MIQIAEEKKRIDWNAIRADYVSGGIGQRKLAEKYGISYPTIRKRAETDGWVKDREEVKRRSIEEATRKTAAMASENATAAERIRQKLLRRLEAEIDALPENIGSNTRQAIITKTVEGRNRGSTTTKDKSKEYKLRDLTAAWRDLTEGLADDGEKEDVVKVIIDV